MPFEYAEINSNAEFENLMQRWKQQCRKEIAVDFECEFNLHIYGNHLCLIQIYDGECFYLVDVLTKDFKNDISSIKHFLEDKTIQKLWFSCKSDSHLVFENYRIRLQNVFDIEILARKLEFQGSLSALIEKELPTVKLNGSNNSQDKKKFQMANWLIRPLPERQKEYALDDVAYLFLLKDALFEKAISLGIEEDVLSAMKDCAYTKNLSKAGYNKVIEKKKLKKETAVFYKNYWIARDNIARDFNLPAFKILDNQILLDMAFKWNICEEDFLKMIKNGNPKISMRLQKDFSEKRKEVFKEINRSLPENHF